LKPQDLLCQLVDVESTTGKEEEIMLLLEGMLEDLGSRPRRIEMADGRFNLLASTGSGRPVLCLNAHADTMPPTGNSLPKSLVDGEVVRGLGSCDDKASITSMLLTFSRLLEEDLAGRLDLLISVDEEISSRGVRTCIESGYRCDYAIVGEPTSLHPIVAHSGLIFLDLLTAGSGGHGSSPWGRRNAILAMMEKYRELETLVSRFPQHPLVGKPSTNLGMIRGGDATNRIPTRCEAKVDVRVMPGHSTRQALEAIDGLFDGVTASYNVYKTGEPMEAGRGSMLLSIVREIETEVLGEELEFKGLRGWTEADPFRNGAGADTLVLGPGNMAEAHSPDEYVELDQVRKASEIYFGVALALLGGDER